MRDIAVFCLALGIGGCASSYVTYLADAFAEVDADPLSTTKRALGYPFRYWSSFIDCDPAPVYLSLNIPVLMVFGEKDTNVPIESARYLEARFREAGKSNFELILAPGADRILVADGKSLRPSVMKRLGEFFLEK